jgi:S1-C subfamily serine protease
VRQAGVIAAVMALTALGLLTVTGGGSGARVPSPDRLSLGVVAIDARIGKERVLSSGTVVDGRAGLVVTTAHTVWGATSLRLTTGLGILHGRLVARAPCAGLAVIEIQPRIPGLAPLPAGGTVTDGLLTVVGRREGSLGSTPLRTVGTGRRADPPLAGALRLDTTVVPEASGGPILDAAGRVVALAAGGSLAIPWSTVEARLAELVVDERRIYVGWRDYYRCAPALHAYAAREHPGDRKTDAVINAPVPATRLRGTQGLDSR